MSKFECNQRHLTLSDRTYIEHAILLNETFINTAKRLHKDPSTISKEVKNNRQTIPPVYKCHIKRCKSCMNNSKCIEKHVCGDERCRYLCHLCSRLDPTRYCMFYLPWFCNKPAKPPYVCNTCKLFDSCILERYQYSATKAQAQYEHRLVNSRTGINMTLEELQQLNDLVSPLILKGQPLSHIFAVHADEIPVCRRTLYNYLDQRVFQARNIDLPRRVRYKKRKKSPHVVGSKLKQVYRNRRTYVDFERFLEAHPDSDVVEMDTVKGSRTSGKCLLTLLFRSCSFMLLILLPKCTQECVVNAIDSLTETIGLHCFRKHFPVILTDNGSEFKNPQGIEKTKDGKHRTYVFYCDPYVSNQKARLEKNHEYIRYFIPKGQSMHRFTQKDINLMASHINSTARDSLNGASPFDLADLLLDKKIPLLTGLKKVSPDEVMLKPALFEKRSE